MTSELGGVHCNLYPLFFNTHGTPNVLNATLHFAFIQAKCIDSVLDVHVLGASHDKIFRIAQKAIVWSNTESHFFQLKRNVVFQIIDLKLEELMDGRIIAFLVLKDIIDGRVILVDSMSASAILKPKKTNRIFDPSQITEKS